MDASVQPDVRERRGLPPWAPAAFCFAFSLAFGYLPAVLATAAVVLTIACCNSLRLKPEVQAAATLAVAAASVAVAQLLPQWLHRRRRSTHQAHTSAAASEFDNASPWASHPDASTSGGGIRPSMLPASLPLLRLRKPNSGASTLGAQGQEAGGSFPPRTNSQGAYAAHPSGPTAYEGAFTTAAATQAATPTAAAIATAAGPTPIASPGSGRHYRFELVDSWPYIVPRRCRTSSESLGSGATGGAHSTAPTTPGGETQGVFLFPASGSSGGGQRHTDVSSSTASAGQPHMSPSRHVHDPQHQHPHPHQHQQQQQTQPHQSGHHQPSLLPTLPESSTEGKTSSSTTSTGQPAQRDLTGTNHTNEHAADLDAATASNRAHRSQHHTQQLTPGPGPPGSLPSPRRAHPPVAFASPVFSTRSSPAARGSQASLAASPATTTTTTTNQHITVTGMGIATVKGTGSSHSAHGIGISSLPPRLPSVQEGKDMDVMQLHWEVEGPAFGRQSLGAAAGGRVSTGTVGSLMTSGAGETVSSGWGSGGWLAGAGSSGNGNAAGQQGLGHAARVHGQGQGAGRGEGGKEVGADTAADWTQLPLTVMVELLRAVAGDHERRSLRLVCREWRAACGGCLTALSPRSLRHTAALTASFPLLQRLDLSGCLHHVTSARLRALAPLRQHLTELVLGCSTGAGAPPPPRPQHAAAAAAAAGPREGPPPPPPPCGVAASVTDRCLPELLHLRGLRALCLAQCVHISDAGIMPLVHLTRLTSLDLTGCVSLTDVGVMLLARLPHLAALQLAWCLKLSNAGLRGLATLRCLEHLTIDGCQLVSEPGVRGLTAITSLRSLSLTNLGYSRVAITDGAIAELAGALDLTHLAVGGLHVSNARVTDAGLAALAAGCPRLESVTLLSVDVTDVGLAALAAECTALTALAVRGCARVTRGGLAALGDMVAGRGIAAGAAGATGGGGGGGGLGAGARGECRLGQGGAWGAGRWRGLGATGHVAAVEAWGLEELSLLHNPALEMGDEDVRRLLGLPASTDTWTGGGSGAGRVWGVGSAACDRLVSLALGSTFSVQGSPSHQQQQQQQQQGHENPGLNAGGLEDGAGAFGAGAGDGGGRGGGVAPFGAGVAGAGGLGYRTLEHLAALTRLTGLVLAGYNGPFRQHAGGITGSHASSSHNTPLPTPAATPGSGASILAHSVPQLHGGHQQQEALLPPAAPPHPALSPTALALALPSPPSVSQLPLPPPPLCALRRLRLLEVVGAGQLDGAAVGSVAAALSGLRTLLLPRCGRVGDDAMEAVGAMGGLQVLNISHCTRVTDAGLSRLASCRSLVQLHAQQLPLLTDAGLAALAPLRRLELIDVSHAGPGVTGAGFGSWTGHRSAHRLCVLLLSFCSGVTDAGVGSACEVLKGVAKVDLAHCALLSDEGAARLAGLRLLTGADLSHCPRVGDATLAALAQLPLLTLLKLPGCVRVSDAGLAALAAGRPAPPPPTPAAGPCLLPGRSGSAPAVATRRHQPQPQPQPPSRLPPQLLTLHLDSCIAVTDAGMSHLTTLSSLTSLRVPRCALTDAGLSALASLTRLCTLSVAHCPAVSAAGVLALSGITSLASLEY